MNKLGRYLGLLGCVMALSAVGCSSDDEASSGKSIAQLCADACKKDVCQVGATCEADCKATQGSSQERAECYAAAADCAKAKACADPPAGGW